MSPRSVSGTTMTDATHRQHVVLFGCLYVMPEGEDAIYRSRQCAGWGQSTQVAMRCREGGRDGGVCRREGRTDARVLYDISMPAW